MRSVLTAPLAHVILMRVALCHMEGKADEGEISYLEAELMAQMSEEKHDGSDHG